MYARLTAMLERTMCGAPSIMWHLVVLNAVHRIDQKEWPLIVLGLTDQLVDHLQPAPLMLSTLATYPLNCMVMYILLYAFWTVHCDIPM